ncbi:MAG: phospho-N-acetylmuramoyl-pentapeptide-transferase, partial [Planctomycetes bacterium]|nr:phospho-N-acetylmuramoyl-pentapeptide-transferase [Planctomycetota bacterium]
SGIHLTPEVERIANREQKILLTRNLVSLNRELISLSFPGIIRPVKKWNVVVLSCIGFMLAFGLLGMVDDYFKLRGLGKQGLSKKQKLVVQFVLAAIGAAVFSTQYDPSITTRMLIPFTKWSDVNPDLGLLYYFLFVIVIVGCSNAVNLTDGLDGLASGCTIMVCVTYAVLSYVVGNAKICEFFRIPCVTDGGELAIMCAVMTGAVMGFLWFNAHPAQVFMGDTGSLALGAGIAFIALAIKQELVLVVAGGVFVVEALSVIIQVFSYKYTKRRVFKCAPFHHHLEFSGWHENKVVIRLWITGAILATLALATLKMH